MKDKLSKELKIIMIVLFPIGIIYCIGKNLFGSNFVAFLGGLFLLIIGFVLAIFLLRPDIVEPIFNFFRLFAK